MLLGVLGTYSPAEIIPYEPDMYNNSAGKRYWFFIVHGLNQAVSLRHNKLFHNENLYFYRRIVCGH